MGSNQSNRPHLGRPKIGSEIFRARLGLFGIRPGKFGIRSEIFGIWSGIFGIRLGIHIYRNELKCVWIGSLIHREPCICLTLKIFGPGGPKIVKSFTIFFEALFQIRIPHVRKHPGTKNLDIWSTQLRNMYLHSEVRLSRQNPARLGSSSRAN